MHPDPRHSLFAAAFALVLAAGIPSTPSAQGAPDPFAIGLRWSRGADLAQPWIPRDVAFVAGEGPGFGAGELLWAAPAVANPRLQLYASAASPPPGAEPLPLFSDTGFGGALGPIGVVAGDDARELYSIAQFAAPTPASRATRVTRHDARAAAAGAAFTPLWTRTFAETVNGPAELACSTDGELLVAAFFDSALGVVRLHALDPATGGSSFERSLVATGLRALAVSPGSSAGARIALAAGSSVYVLDASGSTLFASNDLTLTGSAALSTGGEWLAVGRLGALDLYRDGGAGYALVRTRTAAAFEVPSVAGVSADGGTLAVGWWDSSNGVDVRFEVSRTNDGELVNSLAQGAGAPGLQNLPVDVRLTADGTRIALALWGVGDAEPEVLLLERGNAVPLLAADLAGSPHALDLSADGTRVAIGAKDDHANRFSSTGTLYLFDTGERDLQLTGAARLGGSLDVAFALPVPGTAVFAFGSRRTAPDPVSFGELWVDLDELHFFRVVPGGSVRANVSVPIPNDPALIGLAIAIQAVALGGPGIQLAETVVAVEFL